MSLFAPRSDGRDCCGVSAITALAYVDVPPQVNASTELEGTAVITTSDLGSLFTTLDPPSINVRGDLLSVTTELTSVHESVVLAGETLRTVGTLWCSFTDPSVGIGARNVTFTMSLSLPAGEGIVGQLRRVKILNSSSEGFWNDVTCLSLASSAGASNGLTTIDARCRIPFMLNNTWVFHCCRS